MDIPVMQHGSEPTQLGFCRVNSEVLQTTSQSLSVVFEVGELKLPGHNEHTALPVDFLYFPTTHDTQLPSFGPIKPGLHAQVVVVELEFGKVELSGHFEYTVIRLLKICHLHDEHHFLDVDDPIKSHE
jgi:hypothetical protein